MAHYSVWIVTPHNYPHSAAFHEVAAALNESLIALGHESQIITDPQQSKGTTIVLGANLTNDIPSHFIIFNLEQVFPQNPWLTQSYIDLLKKAHTVWDYSQENIKQLAANGVKAKFCGIGYSPCLTTIVPPPEQDIDVLHVGSLTDRRVVVINELASHNIRVHYLFGVYGKERDDWIARSKIILNVHFYESTRFEIVRCSHLMANRKCIVSETSDGGELFNEAICFDDYSNLVSRCVDLVGDDARRNELADRGFETFSKLTQVDYLKELL